jgi:hypothetical protein
MVCTVVAVALLLSTGSAWAQELQPPRSMSLTPARVRFVRTSTCGARIRN